MEGDKLSQLGAETNWARTAAWKEKAERLGLKAVESIGTDEVIILTPKGRLQIPAPNGRFTREDIRNIFPGNFCFGEDYPNFIVFHHPSFYGEKDLGFNEVASDYLAEPCAGDILVMHKDRMPADLIEMLGKPKYFW